LSQITQVGKQAVCQRGFLRIFNLLGEKRHADGTATIAAKLL